MQTPAVRIVICCCTINILSLFFRLLIIHSSRRPLIPYSIQLANHHHDHPHRLVDLQMLWAGNSCRARRRQLFSPMLDHLLFLMITYSSSHKTLNTIFVLAFLITLHCNIELRQNSFLKTSASFHTRELRHQLTPSRLKAINKSWFNRTKNCSFF